MTQYEGKEDGYRDGAASRQAEYEGWLADRRAELRADDDGMRSFSADKENGK